MANMTRVAETEASWAWQLVELTRVRAGNPVSDSLLLFLHQLMNQEGQPSPHPQSHQNRAGEGKSSNPTAHPPATVVFFHHCSSSKCSHSSWLQDELAQLVRRRWQWLNYSFCWLAVITSRSQVLCQRGKPRLHLRRRSLRRCTPARELGPWELMSRKFQQVGEQNCQPEGESLPEAGESASCPNFWTKRNTQ